MTYRSFSAAEYRKAGIGAGPFALEGNPDPEKRNYRTSRRKPILGVVMHITVGLTDYVLPDASAEGTTKYGADTTRDASWHVCTDSDGIIPSIRDAYVAWHAGVSSDYWSHPARPYINDATLGMEQGTSQVDWRRAPADWVARILRNDAVWLAPRVKKYGIPLVVVRDRNVMGDAIMAGRPFGFIAHATIAPNNRRDPGMVGNPPTWVDTYPWSQLFTYIREEMALLDGTAPAPEPVKEWSDMATKEEIKQAVREVMAEEATAVELFTGHNIVQDTPNGGDPAPRVTPSTLLEAAAKPGLTPEQLAAAVEAGVRKALGSVDNGPSTT